MKKKTLIAVILGQLTVLALYSYPAFSTAEAIGARNLARIENASNTTAITLNGELVCQMAAENNGQGCTLKLREAKSGRLYELQNPSTAMRLYQDNRRNNASLAVRVQGTLAGENTITVSRLEQATTTQ